MEIILITEDEYKTILEIQEKHPKLTFQNNGYEYVDKSKFSAEDFDAFDKIQEILRKHIGGFSKFNNFKISKSGEKQIRFQYNYSHNTNNIPFTGVGYLEISELLNGFKK